MYSAALELQNDHISVEGTTEDGEETSGQFPNQNNKENIPITPSNKAILNSGAPMNTYWTP